MRAFFDSWAHWRWPRLTCAPAAPQETVALVRPEFEQAWKHADVTLRVADI